MSHVIAMSRVNKSAASRAISHDTSHDTSYATSCASQASVESVYATLRQLAEGRDAQFRVMQCNAMYQPYSTARDSAAFEKRLVPFASAIQNTENVSQAIGGRSDKILFVVLGGDHLVSRKCVVVGKMCDHVENEIPLPPLNSLPERVFDLHTLDPTSDPTLKLWCIKDQTRWLWRLCRRLLMADVSEKSQICAIARSTCAVHSERKLHTAPTLGQLQMLADKLQAAPPTSASVFANDDSLDVASLTLHRCGEHQPPSQIMFTPRACCGGLAACAYAHMQTVS